MINFLSINRKKLNESEEDELEWVQDLMNQNPIPKSIKLGDGKRFIIPSSKSYSKDWGKFRGWNYWKDVVRIDGIFGEHCYVINDRTWGEIYVPIIDFSPNEIKFDTLNESEEDEFEWARDVINSPIKDVIEGQYYRVNNDMSDEPFYYTIDIFVKEITRGPKNTQDIIYYDSLCNSEDPDDMENDNKTDEVVTYKRAKELVETGYWIPITKEQSLFNKENINESEEDELGWAEDVVSDEFFRWGDIKKHLDDGDIISVTGDMRDSEGELDLVLDNEPFIVKRSGGRLNLRWSNNIDKRPTEWQSVTELNKDWIQMLGSTAEWDDELIIKILKKEEHPF